MDMQRMQPKEGDDMPRGPVPKRSDERRRVNIPDGPSLVHLPAGPCVDGDREGDPEWHPIVQEMWNSLAKSGQSQRYEESDWAFARYTHELAHRTLTSEKGTPAMLVAQVMGALTELLVSEGARRRARIELERGPTVEPASVALMDKYRNAASDT